MKIAKFLPWCGAASCALALQVSANTIYLVRHAEKQDDSKDPALSVCGQARATALADYFANITLGAVYATPYQRTQQTAAAVADSKKISVNHYDPGKPEQLVQQLSTAAAPVLVVGHSNTVPELVKLLSGIDVAPLTEQQYNLLYQVQLGAQGSVTIRQQSFQCQSAPKP
ncbi:MULTISPECIES: SixA phosphatase family protein [unclassified Arsukibacterium]|uniref:SixA phosphatase family protein n=1 Tax=unclassified Arsukibacterium TaxID=2635278 RepID=UPI000C5078D1|nr:MULTISPECIES: phosphoglycerate mutase family protein [unclassified Arsukibacterium]MAA94118.1 histidine phosphatase family protein [Rheinheimera sp.]MBM35159.1 histidine phosphatase family protein [Rheinheimera sp.]HAW93531.1 histidine phosphatase family protein [Candidatus Azambacteria bacterium]|tara:strand:- start:572 stop:1081 length:510 start_codon:yes stop_codon:yes gene_type:complete